MRYKIVLSHPRQFKLGELWWWFLLRGFLTSLFGLLAVLSPGATVESLILLLGVIFALDGLLILIASMERIESNMGFKYGIAQGTVSLVCGLTLALFPTPAINILLLLIGIWLLLLAAFEFFLIWNLRNLISTAWAVFVLPLVTLIVGVLLVRQPMMSMIGLMVVIGIWCLFFGVLQIASAFQFKKRGLI